MGYFTYVKLRDVRTFRRSRARFINLPCNKREVRQVLTQKGVSIKEV